MRTLLLAPHYDDEILFASYAIMRSKPDIAWVFIPMDDTEAATRRRESENALRELIGGTLSLRYLGGWEGQEILSLDDVLQELAAPSSPLSPDAHPDLYDHIVAPMVEPGGGHEEHNRCGRAALNAFGPERITYYATYQRGRPRGDTYGSAPLVPTTDEIQRKLRALACFTSQIDHPARRPWFYDLFDLREWYS